VKSIALIVVKRGFYFWDNEWDEELDTRDYKKIKFQVFFDPKTVELFEKFINECKKLNINLILT
jgi:hypothetical protein